MCPISIPVSGTKGISIETEATNIGKEIFEVFQTMCFDSFLNLRKDLDRFFLKTSIYTHKVVEAANFPEGPLKTNAGGECFAPFRF